MNVSISQASVKPVLSDAKEIIRRKPPKRPKYETGPQLASAIEAALRSRARLTVHEAALRPRARLTVHDLAALFPEHFRDGPYIADITVCGDDDGKNDMIEWRGITSIGITALDLLANKFRKHRHMAARRGQYTSPHRLPCVGLYALDLDYPDDAARRRAMKQSDI